MGNAIGWILLIGLMAYVAHANGVFDEGFEFELPSSNVRTIQECNLEPERCEGREIRINKAWYTTWYFFGRHVKLKQNDWKVNLDEESCDDFPGFNLKSGEYYDWIGIWENNTFSCTEPPIRNS